MSSYTDAHKRYYEKNKEKIILKQKGKKPFVNHLDYLKRKAKEKRIQREQQFRDNLHRDILESIKKA